MQSAIEQVFLRFPHLSENIFGQLNSEFLAKSKEVSRSWYDYLDGQKFLENRADKVKEVMETIRKLGAPKVSLLKKHLLIWKKTKKSIIDDARNGNYDSVQAKIMNNIEAMYSRAIWGGLARYAKHPIFIAVYFDHFDVLKYLVDNLEDNNPKIDGFDERLGATPLHTAASGGRIDMVKYIMSKVLDKNPKDSSGLTPLHHAAAGGKLDIVKYLMERLEDNSPKNGYGVTPLHMAAERRQFIVYKYIVENVVEKNPRDKDGYTPLDIVHELGYLEIFKPASTYLGKVQALKEF